MSEGEGGGREGMRKRERGGRREYFNIHVQIHFM